MKGWINFELQIDPYLFKEWHKINKKLQRRNYTKIKKPISVVWCCGIKMSIYSQERKNIYSFSYIIKCSKCGRWFDASEKTVQKQMSRLQTTKSFVYSLRYAVAKELFEGKLRFV